jgi:hypothetical protein
MSQKRHTIFSKVPRLTHERGTLAALSAECVVQTGLPRRHIPCSTRAHGAEMSALLRTNLRRSLLRDERRGRSTDAEDGGVPSLLRRSQAHWFASTTYKQL